MEKAIAYGGSLRKHGEMSCTERILGLGSPHGDDQVGWRLLDTLRARSSLSAETIVIRHAIELLDHLEACDRLILVDGCQTGAAPGTVTRLDWPDARIHSQHRRSTHDLDVASALQLADTLGKLPGTVIILGIEIGSCQPETELSDSVARALGGFEQCVLDALAEPVCRDQIVACQITRLVDVKGEDASYERERISGHTE